MVDADALAGRIFEFVHGEEINPPIINSSVLPQIIQVLLSSIGEPPYISEKVRADS